MNSSTLSLELNFKFIDLTNFFSLFFKLLPTVEPIFINLFCNMNLFHIIDKIHGRLSGLYAQIPDLYAVIDKV